MCAYKYTCIHVEEQGNTHKRIGIASTSSCLAGIPNMPDITVWWAVFARYIEMSSELEIVLEIA